MERVAIVVRLKQGNGPRAAQLIEAGPPFDLAETGMVQHSVYLSAGEVVFVFEGPQVEWIVDDLVDNPFHPKVRAAFERWRSIVDGPPRVAREQFGWAAHQTVLPAGEVTARSAT